MKNKKNLILLLVGFPFIKYLPFNYNFSINNFFYNNSFNISLLSLLILTVLLIYKKSKILFIAFFMVLIQFFGNSFFQEACNQVIIKINDNREIKDFINPFLGTKMSLYENMASFVFDKNDFLFTYKILYYNEDVHLDKSKWLGFENKDVIKIYNEKWYSLLVD